MLSSFTQRLPFLSPKPAGDGSFGPSALALKLATEDKTNFDGGVYETPYSGARNRIVMVCTEQAHMTMKNGKKFSTGNHPVEMMLPMLHLTMAGFEIDVITPTGAPVKIEMWAMPQKDEAVAGIYERHRANFENPGSVPDFVERHMNTDSPYVAVFIPGGHGAMLGLPDNSDVGKIIHWAHDNGLFMLALCHGPAALLAASPEVSGRAFPYVGYKMTAFPDAVDEQTPLVGYMPGHMPWKFGERLSDLGVTIINTKADGACHVDRKLISGDSPKAANGFGRLSATTLLEAMVDVT